MRKTLLITTGLAWLALTGAANAFMVKLTPGPMNPQYFEAEIPGQNGFTLGGIGWSLVSGFAATERGTAPGFNAAPLGMGNTTYMAVESGGVEKATFAAPRTSISLYWGSIDSVNTLITVGSQTFTGAQLVAFGATDNGSQSEPTSNELVTITGLTPFTTALFSSPGKNSFEFTLAGGVPEPSTWAMMVLGFAGLGYAAFRRNSKGRALAI
jgi:hypothetical protein